MSFSLQLRCQVRLCLPLAGVVLFGMSIMSAAASSSFLPEIKRQHQKHTDLNMVLITSYTVSTFILGWLEMCFDEKL